jgi:hypothetical protein
VRVRGAGEVEQVGLLGLIELQSAGERDEDGLRRAGEVAAFEAGVVVDADAGQHRDLLPAQPLDPAVRAVERQPGLVGSDPGAARDQELADLPLRFTFATVRSPPPA